MTDREKVIRGLECCSLKECDMVCPKVECPYIHLRGEYEDAYYECTSRLSADALTLLREQEPVTPENENCPECGYTLHRINYYGPDKELRHEWFRFCPSCGRVVKWDD